MHLCSSSCSYTAPHSSSHGGLSLQYAPVSVPIRATVPVIRAVPIYDKSVREAQF